MVYKSVTRQFLTYFQLGSENPNIAFLSKLVQAFAQLPYENLTKIIKSYRSTNPGDKLRMPDEVMEDHIRYGTGGTCFSLTFTLQQILEGCGFECYPVMADRSYGPNTHCALIVPWQGQKFLVDPGFLLSKPLPLTEELQAIHRFPTNFVQFEKSQETSNYRIYTLDGSGRKWRYTLKEQPVSAEELRTHWLQSFSWNMMNSLLVTRATPQNQLYLRNNYLQITTENQQSKQRIQTEFVKVISQLFKIPEEIILEAQHVVQQQKHKKCLK